MSHHLYALPRRRGRARRGGVGDGGGRDVMLQRNTFDQQIKTARQRLETLQQHAGGTSPEQTDLAMTALEELSNALEELHVAGEELRQQNDELAAPRQAVEAERQRYEELFE